MANLSEIKKDSNWGDVSNTINSNFQNINVELDKVKSSTTKFKGYFTTEEALKDKFQSPNSGDTAWVGEPYPGKVYDVQSGQWHNTNTYPNTGSVELNEYINKTEFEENKQQQDEKFTEIEKKKQDILEFDKIPTVNSLNPVTSGGIREALDSQKSEVDAAKDEAVQAIDISMQSAIANFNKQRVTPEMLSESTLQIIQSSGSGEITNLADDEDIESKENELGINVLKFANRNYNPTNHSGKGYKILRKNIVNGKNILTQDMINQENTVYEVRYDYDLNNDEIIVPEGCILKFEGGAVNNGKINGNNTSIKYNGIYRCFNSVVLEGTFNVKCLYIENFSSVQEAFDNAGKLAVQLKLLSKTYSIKNSIILRDGYTYNINGNNPSLNSYYKAENGSNIISENVELFTSEKTDEDITIMANISGIHFRRSYINSESILFKNIIFSFSVIENISTLNFGTIFFGGLNLTTKVRFNSFEGISKCFCSNTGDTTNLNDCDISYNYINGKPDSNATCFIINNVDYCRINNNFIDFFKYIFSAKKTGSLHDLQICNNTFDYCFSMSKPYTRYSSCIFDNNVFSRFNKDYISSFPNSDEDMTSTDIWIVFNQPLFYNCVINNSIVKYTKKFIYVYKFDYGATVQGINDFIAKITNTSFTAIPSDADKDKLIEFSLYSNINSNYRTFYIDAFDYICFDELPNPYTSQTIYYFNFQHVIVNDDIYMYLNKKWIKIYSNYNDVLDFGTFLQKPLNPKIGFAYFCTDKQTTEGKSNGITIYYKGDNVWVDSLGRIVK